jgi:hypothetical protein
MRSAPASESGRYNSKVTAIRCLSQVRIDEFQEFVVHGFGFRFFGAAEGLGGAVVQVVAHQVAGYAAKRFLDAGDLGDDVGAVAVVFDHFLQAANLAFDSAQAVAIGFFQLRMDGNGLSGFARNRAGAIGGLGSRRRFALGREAGWQCWIPPGAIYTPRGYICQIEEFGVERLRLEIWGAAVPRCGNVGERRASVSYFGWFVDISPYKPRPLNGKRAARGCGCLKTRESL